MSKSPSLPAPSASTLFHPVVLFPRPIPISCKEVGENDAVIGLVDVDPNIDDEKEDEAKWRDICIGIASLCLLFLFWRCDVR
ncbi:hypothetical protein B296_00002354 [Ensete ventricosum]|uniref:Uncharacterized protein n=1 Tax=Ensete ventricosum TaxID=4639 RepID=A0A427B1T5_ENSVE|nr:hypothetical protein B296_00002354 [Ensete ventricosum]